MLPRQICALDDSRSARAHVTTPTVLAHSAHSLRRGKNPLPKEGRSACLASLPGASTLPVMKAVGLFFVLLLLALPAWGTERVTRSAEDLLRRTEATYTGLTSFHFAAEEVTETRSGDTERRISANYVTALDAKGRSRVEIRDQSKNGVAVFDGEYNWVFLPSVNQFTRSQSGPTGDSVMGQHIVDGVDLTEYIERYPWRYQGLSRNLVSATILRHDALDGETLAGTYTVVEAQYKLPAGAPVGKATRTFWIDEQGFLIVREVSRATAKPPGLENPVEIIQTISFATAQANEETPDSLFVFIPPADAEQVQTFRRRARGPATFVGEPAQDFSLQDLKGRTFRLRDQRGKIVLLDFWASWCTPCRIDLPHIEALQREHSREDLIVLGVNSESAPVARSFMQQQGYSFPSLVDEGYEVSDQYQATSLPTIVIVDREGNISSYLVGLQRESDLHRALSKAGLP